MSRDCSPRPVGRALGRVCRAGLGSLALLFLMADDGIGRDEFMCEVAVGHLQDCCPTLGTATTMLACTHGGCDSKLTPDLTEDRSDCIQHKSCDELSQLGACDVASWEPAPSCTTSPCSVTVPPCK